MKNLRYLATNLSKVGNGSERNFCFSRKEKSGNHFAQKTCEQRNMELKVFQI